MAMSTPASREERLRELAAASVAVGAGASLEDVLQKTVDAVAKLVRASYAALGTLDRAGSGTSPAITVCFASYFARRARSALPM